MSITKSEIEPRDIINGACSMLRESAKMHRLQHDDGHARMCDLHADKLDRIISFVIARSEYYGPTERT